MQHYNNLLKIESISAISDNIIAVWDVPTCFEKQEKGVWTESESEFQLLQINVFFLCNCRDVAFFYTNSVLNAKGQPPSTHHFIDFDMCFL